MMLFVEAFLSCFFITPMMRKLTCNDKFLITILYFRPIATSQQIAFHKPEHHVIIVTEYLNTVNWLIVA